MTHKGLLSPPVIDCTGGRWTAKLTIICGTGNKRTGFLVVSSSLCSEDLKTVAQSGETVCGIGAWGKVTQNVACTLSGFAWHGVTMMCGYGRSVSNFVG